MFVVVALSAAVVCERGVARVVGRIGQVISCGIVVGAVTVGAWSCGCGMRLVLCFTPRSDPDRYLRYGVFVLAVSLDSTVLLFN